MKPGDRFRGILHYVLYINSQLTYLLTYLWTKCAWSTKSHITFWKVSTVNTPDPCSLESVLQTLVTPHFTVLSYIIYYNLLLLSIIYLVNFRSGTEANVPSWPVFSSRCCTDSTRCYSYVCRQRTWPQVTFCSLFCMPNIQRISLMKYFVSFILFHLSYYSLIHF